VLLWSLAGPLVSAQTSEQKPRFSKYSRTEIEIKFNEEAAVNLSGDDFVSTTGRDLGKTRETLKKHKILRKKPLFGASQNELRENKRRTAQAGKAIPDLGSYYRLSLDDKADINKVVAELKASADVEDVYAAPLPTPAPSSPNLVGEQTHLKSTPVGLGITDSAQLKGGNGAYVKIADIEYSWNINHEDTPKARQSGVVVPVGTPVDPFNDDSHGTQVVGVLSGAKNSIGVNGASYASSLRLVNAFSSDYGWNPALAITTATSKLAAGDVILLEQQAAGPNGEYLPIEWIPSVYDAIRAATASGVIVIEAAGNGSTNLDDTKYGSTFPMGKVDSGAVMVGAGAACDWLTPRQRLYFSNYGQRVNVQGLGSCVTTTGVGDRYDGGSKNSQYTSYFNGTSSASATIAGAVAQMSSSIEISTGVAATPSQIRTLLMQHGAAQNNDDNLGNIGILPNTYQAILSTDKKAPTVPSLSSAIVSYDSNMPFVSWKVSTDNLALSGYQVYRNGVLIATTGKTAKTFTDKTAQPKTNYTYRLKAIDRAGNSSAFSNSLSVTTL
jgi:hypothetical protein